MPAVKRELLCTARELLRPLHCEESCRCWTAHEGAVAKASKATCTCNHFQSSSPVQCLPTPKVRPVSEERTVVHHTEEDDRSRQCNECVCITLKR